MKEQTLGAVREPPLHISTAMSPIHSFQIPAFLRALFLIFSAVVYTALLGPPASVSCFLDRSGRWPSFFQKLWVNWLLWTNGIHLDLEGIESLNQEESYILVSNHASILDILGIISAAPFPVRFIAKKSLVWFPIFGWFLHAAGHILIDRQKTTSAFQSLKKASSLLQKGISIIVFPEGTRSPDGEVKEFKRGGFLLAQRSKYPVVPVSIAGTYEMLPRQGWCFWTGTMHIRLSDPIPTRHLSRQEARDLMGRVRVTMIENLDHRNEERRLGFAVQGEMADEAVQESRC
jgi:1-acyl-sn-glycerol-3-phosphate acyltransferase